MQEYKQRARTLMATIRSEVGIFYLTMGGGKA
jgi:hypothetical protein